MYKIVETKNNISIPRIIAKSDKHIITIDVNKKFFDFQSDTFNLDILKTPDPTKYDYSMNGVVIHIDETYTIVSAGGLVFTIDKQLEEFGLYSDIFIGVSFEKQ